MNVTAPSDAIIADFRKASSLTGLLTRVAKKLELSPSHVRQVALGNRKSDRVMRELTRERNRLARAAERQAA